MINKAFLLLFLGAALSLNYASAAEALGDEMLGIEKAAAPSAGVKRTLQLVGVASQEDSPKNYWLRGCGLEDSNPDQVEWIKKTTEERRKKDFDEKQRNLTWPSYIFGLFSKAYHSLFGYEERSNFTRTEVVQIVPSSITNAPNDDELSATAGGTTTSKMPTAGSTSSSTVTITATEIFNVNVGGTIVPMTFSPAMVYDQKKLNTCTANVMAFIIRHWSVVNSVDPTNFTTTNTALLNPSRIYHYINAAKLIAGKQALNGQDSVNAEQSIFAIDKYGTCPEVVTTVNANISNTTQQVNVGMIYPIDADSTTITLTQPQVEHYRFALDPNTTGLSTGDVNAYAVPAQKIRYSWLGSDVTQYKAALSSGYPIFFGTRLYSAFMNSTIFGSKAKFFVPIPTELMPDKTAQKLVGGHAMTICGYGNYNPDVPAKNYFKVLNSWGSTWADGGFCYFPEEYITGSTAGVPNTVSAYSVYFAK